ncbi:phosphatidylserine decarboxylase [Pseudomonas sp. LFM046]|uniref:phosphatidylserine decarboxylase n=1 Tax=Pseudomonas sp. LFM046 TaxID=1608357 RepID=UPI0009E46B9C|nr:phosphatidylserine decarboxylase [Pseudomonas sp. LFM046]
MSKSLRDWLATDISPIKDQPISWISQHHFFRDPVRPAYSDMSYFFSPADGIILYQKTVRGDESIIDIKGRPYSLQDALRDPGYEAESLVIGIFMTMYDVHVNRVPYPGRLSYRELDPIDTINHPMLDVETSLLEDLGIAPDMLDYLHHNQRMVNRIDSPELGLSYFVLQIADYDVDCITPFTLKQHHAVYQGERFSQIRYGSQVDLIVPLSSRFVFETLQSTGDHVEAGVDALIRISESKHTSSSAEEDFPYAVKYGASVPHVSQ